MRFSSVFLCWLNACRAVEYKDILLWFQVWVPNFTKCLIHCRLLSLYWEFCFGCIMYAIKLSSVIFQHPIMPCITHLLTCIVLCIMKWWNFCSKFIFENTISYSNYDLVSLMLHTCCHLICNKIGLFSSICCMVLPEINKNKMPNNPIFTTNVRHGWFMYQKLCRSGSYLWGASPCVAMIASSLVLVLTFLRSGCVLCRFLAFGCLCDAFLN